MILAHFSNPVSVNKGLMIGLSDENIKRLTAGNPIRCTRKTHGEGVPEGWEILIIHGKTEQEIVASLRNSGALGEHTLVKQMPHEKTN